MEALCGRGEVFSIWKEEKKDGQQNERKERRKNREGTALRSLKQLMLTLNRGNGPMMGSSYCFHCPKHREEELRVRQHQCLFCFNDTVLLSQEQVNGPDLRS